MKSPAFQFYVADYLCDEHVQTMTLEEEGAYIRLLCHCWREGSIPNDDQKLSALTKGGSTTLLATVKQRFVVGSTTPDRLIHPRLEKEREKQLAWREKSREGGLSSGKQRCNKETKGGSRVVQPNGNSSSSSSSSKEERREEAPPNKAVPGSKAANNVVEMRQRNRVETEQPVESVAVVNGGYVSGHSNGNGHYVGQPREKTMESPEDEFASWAEGVYRRHPKKARKFEALILLKDLFAHDLERRAIFDKNHKLWIRTDGWTEKNGAFAPRLFEWLQDDGYLSAPYLAEEHYVEVPEL